MLESRPTGRRTWYWRYTLEGKRRLMRLGRWPGVSLADARRKAADLRQLAARGIDPRAPRVEGITLRACAEAYLQEVAAKRRKSVAPVQRELERMILPALGHLPVASITPEHVRALVFAHRDAGFPAAAASLRGTIKRICDYAMACGHLSANPCAGVPMQYIAAARSRNRVLSRDEIAWLVQRLRSGSPCPSRAGLLLLLLTAARKSELLKARWREMDLERREWAVPAEHSKTGQPQIFFLARQAVEILRAMEDGAPDGYVLHAEHPDVPLERSTLNQVLARLRKGQAHCTVHDLRRTAATHMREMGYDADWVEATLGHKLAGVRGVYNRAQYREGRREMAQAWADSIIPSDTVESTTYDGQGKEAGPSPAIPRGGNA